MEYICLMELSKNLQQEMEAQKQQEIRVSFRERDKDNNSDFNFAEFVRLKNENRLLKTQLAGGGSSIPQPAPLGTRYKSPILPSINSSGGVGGSGSSGVSRR